MVAAADCRAWPRDAFYQGEIAQKILDHHEAPRRSDVRRRTLAEYSSEFVEPISTTYREWTVYELPPNGQGLAALEMLNIMEKFPLGQSKEWGFSYH